MQAAIRDHPQTSAARGSFLLIGCFVLTSAENYAFAILMSWLLPVHEFGILGVAQAVMLLGGTIMGAGFPWALTRRISEEASLESSAGALRMALVGNVAVGLVFGVLAFGVTSAGASLSGEYPMAMLLVGATVEMLAVASVFLAALRGLLRFSGAALVLFVEATVKLLVGGVLVLLGAGALGAVAGFVAGAAASAVVAVVALRDVRFGRGRAASSGIRDLAGLVAPLFVGMCGLAALIYGDTIGLKAFSPAGISDQITGYYQAAVTLSRIPVFVAIALCGALFPYLSRYAAGPSRSMSRFYAASALKYTTLFILPLNLVLIAIPDQVIRTLYSSKYDASAQPLRFAALGSILLVFVQALTTLLQTSGGLCWTALVLPAAVVVEVAALAGLVPAFGAVGAGLSLVIAGAFALCFLVPLAVRAYGLKCPIRTFVSTSVALAIPVVVLLLLPRGGRVITLVTVLAAGVLYVAALLLLGLLHAADLETFASGLGPRLNRHLKGTIDMLGRISPRRQAKPT